MPALASSPASSSERSFFDTDVEEKHIQKMVEEGLACAHRWVRRSLDHRGCTGEALSSSLGSPWGAGRPLVRRRRGVFRSTPGKLPVFPMPLPPPGVRLMKEVVPVALVLALVVCFAAGSSPAESNVNATPRHGHIAFSDGCGGTGAIRVMWNTVDDGPWTSVVQVGLSAVSLDRNFTTSEGDAGVLTTYTADDLCAPSGNISAPGFHHGVVIDDCEFLGQNAGKSVYYRYGSDAGWSDVMAFRAPPAVGSDEAFSFIVYKDMDTQGAPQSVATAERVLKEVRRHHTHSVYANACMRALPAAQTPCPAVSRVPAERFLP